MAGAVPVRRSKIHEKLVQDLAGDQGHSFEESQKKLFPTIRELLSFAAMLGFSEDRKTKLDKSAGLEDIQPPQYESSQGSTALEILWAIAVAHTKSTDILKDGMERECTDIFEEYANGGLDIISDWILSAADKPSYEAIIQGLQRYDLLNLTVKDNGELPGNIDF